MRGRRTLPTLLAAVVAGALLLAACGSDAEPVAEAAPTDAAPAAPTDVAPGVESARLALSEDRVVIDVRTPAEFAEGAVAGAVLLDVSDPGFAAGAAELDPEASYVVYCRSGNRSAAATAQLRGLGLDVVDGGGLPSMLDAGYTLG